MTDQATSISMRTTDLDEIEVAISALPLELHRLTTDDGSVGITSAACGDVSILAGEFGFPVVTHGDVAGDFLVVALQLEPGAGSWNGVEFSLDRAWLYRPGSEHFGVGRARPPRFATISVPVADGLRRDVDRSGSVTPSSEVVHDHNVGILRTSVLDILAAGLSGTLTPESADRAGRDLIETLASIEPVAEPTRVDRSSATRITQQCIALADSLDPVPAMVDLVSAIGVSDRWIRAAFRKVYGISPQAFFRARAIAGAHRQLRTARPDSVTVTEVAMAWGFWHLGRFSAAYRSYFDELPSETLRRVE